MNVFSKFKFKDSSKIYLGGISLFIILLFLLTSVVFIWISAGKLEILLNQQYEITCTYLVSIIDRVLLALIVILLIPLTLYQTLTKNETKTDYILNYLAVSILLIFCLIFISGELHYFKSYKKGILNNSPLFSQPTIETKIFDRILKK